MVEVSRSDMTFLSFYPVIKNPGGGGEIIVSLVFYSNFVNW